ncbi:MAG: GC-type dockerin domain-anchored protein [Phycisphaerales bacterium]|nr:GC-type dockerin domain-anchored protein [Phycisphaerales bacterium]
MKSGNKKICIMTLVAAAASTSQAGERDLQFINIHPQDQVLMLQNTGIETLDLDGWRFCTHNTTQTLRYSSSSGLNGVSVDPGESISIHLNNDAQVGNPNQFNASDIGNFAGFEIEAYGLSLYFPNAQGNTPFSDGNFIADHIQWSFGGVDNTSADERSDEAEDGGVWVDQSEWISTQADTVLIELIDQSFGELHSPTDYNVIQSCPADLNGDGQLNFFDVSVFLSAFAAMDPAADFDGNLNFNFFDVSAFLTAFANGCP